MPKARSRSATTESSDEIARDRPGDVVRDGGSADAALGADHGDDAADRLGVGRENRPQIARTTSMVPTGAIR